MCAWMRWRDGIFARWVRISVEVRGMKNSSMAVGKATDADVEMLLCLFT